ncbi:cation:proton antiporter [Sutterella sp.]|uniref:cation:proton antiporter n=1 Tax=Sutterella sp. TaxID=1981025 RepID=UPI0026DFF26A|nr:cation:proton antiporter [Sutterella sp.]MDO5532292.1 cation:proton antiporter [Sutterella sp.]
MHSYSLITSLVTGFGLALPFGYLVERFLKFPALVGYIMAGLAVTMIPGLPPVSSEMISELAEIGVMLLMFGVGLHFSVKDLLRVKGIALPGAALQMLFAAVLGALVAMGFWHWSFGAAVLFGFSISCASTVVVMKALEIRNLTSEMNGQVAVGWLVMEDLVSVLLLVCLPSFAAVVQGSQDVSALEVALEVAKTLAWAAVFVVLMLVAGRKILPWVLREVANTGSRELFTLTILGSAIIIAYGASAIFDVSFALGAFFAGMVMQESRFAHRAAQESLPLQDAFSVLFFVSVGMMLDWHIFLQHPWEIFLVVLIIVVGKMSISFLIVILLKWPLGTALTVGACLGQIGEFSFILAGQGISLNLVDQTMMSVIVAAAIITIAVNPALFWLEPHLSNFFVHRFRWAKRAAMRQPPFSQLPANTPREMLDGQVVVVGGSEASHELFKALEKNGRRTIVICSPSDPIEELRARGFGVIVGEATDPMVLVQAHVMKAGVLVMPSSKPLTAKNILAVTRQLNATIPVVVLVKSVEDAALFEGEDENLSILCEPLMTSIGLTAVTINELVKREEAAEEQEKQMRTVRDLLDAEYRRSVSAVRGVPSASEEEAADLQAAAAKVAGEAMATMRERQPVHLSARENAASIGRRIAGWVREKKDAMAPKSRGAADGETPAEPAPEAAKPAESAPEDSQKSA